MQYGNILLSCDLFSCQENSNQFPNSVCPYSSVNHVRLVVCIHLYSCQINFELIKLFEATICQSATLGCFLQHKFFFDVTSVSSYIFFIFVLQKQPPEVFHKEGAPETFVKLTVKRLCGSMRLQTSGLNLHTSGLQPY